MAIYAVQFRYGGFTGAPGFSTLHFIGSNETASAHSDTKAQAAHDLATTFLTNLFGASAAVGADLDGDIEADIIARDYTTGAGLALYSGTPAGVHSAGTSETLPSANCLVITWRSIVFGPRGRGRTFLAPGDETQSVDGTPSATVVANAKTHADALIAAAVSDPEVELGVWHRPTPSLPSSGSVAAVVQASVTSQWALLRSRRD